VYPLRRAYATALGAAGHHSAAQGVLETLARVRPQDESIWYALDLIQDDYPMTARVSQRMADLREMRLRLAG
jgi:hypothetical protein